MKNPIIEKHMREILLKQVLDQYVQTILERENVDIREKRQKKTKSRLTKNLLFSRKLQFTIITY